MKYLTYIILFSNLVKLSTHIIVGPVHDVVDPVVEPQHELGPGYQPQQAGGQSQQVIPHTGQLI